jgi:dihydrofolate synthase/folylpolyglutamate synthase
VSHFLDDYFAALQRFGIRPGLERVRALLHSAGNPEQKFPAVLVGGTNGKGSTCEFLARGFSASRRIGLYTSPHLNRWNERIRIVENGDASPQSGKISDTELETLLREAAPHLEAVTKVHGTPTEFETLTFLGFWHFARQNVDAAVVEVGLGGKWDATNVCEPLVSVVTHVALDHCDRLGNTLEEIAADKIYIARPNRVCVTAETKPEVLRVFQEHCDAIGAHLQQISTVEFREPHEVQADTSTVPHWQQLNARTAAAAARALETALGWPHSEENISLAVAGRAEIVRQNPTVLLDGANNPDGALRLAEYLRAAFPNRRIIFVAGMSADKDFRAMLRIWREVASRFITTQAQHPRAAGAEELAQTPELTDAVVEAIPDVRGAVARALQLATPNDVIVVSGSFFVLSEVERNAL